MFSFRLIEELKLSLKSKDALIQCLKEEKSQMASPDETLSSGELQVLSAALRGDGEGEAEVRHGGGGGFNYPTGPPCGMSAYSVPTVTHPGLQNTRSLL